VVYETGPAPNWNHPSASSIARHTLPPPRKQLIMTLQSLWQPLRAPWSRHSLTHLKVWRMVEAASPHKHMNEAGPQLSLPKARVIRIRTFEARTACPAPHTGQALTCCKVARAIRRMPTLSALIREYKSGKATNQPFHSLQATWRCPILNNSAQHPAFP
jgi:hypothetical protein